jgi:uncharacterized protein YfbU (UPF0304 family)
MEVDVIMSRTVAIGIQDFGKIIEGNYFYVDKTHFIKEWWESGDEVTLITRPRRFGKTLNMSMVERFFSIDYANQWKIFENLSIGKEEKYKELQGSYPVISLSFANIKGSNFSVTKDAICQLIVNLYSQYDFLRDSEVLTIKDKEYFERISIDMREIDATMSLHQLSDYLYRYYKKKVIILLDEYDTPMQEAYVNGYWDEIIGFTRSLFNSTFKTNPYLERAIMTGITRVSKESIFSDLNNLKVVTTTSNEYATSFGFTQKEVFLALDEYGMQEKEKVKQWYDGFVFGEVRDIYNPWSIINLLDTNIFSTYWANTSANGLVGKLIREGSGEIKEQFEILLQGNIITSELDEQIVYSQLDDNEDAIWSLLIASGYLKVLQVDKEESIYQLGITNYEVEKMFKQMIKGWFKRDRVNYNSFIKAMLLDDLDAMNEYMNEVALNSFSYFDTGKQPSREEPERFYHGFVLGLMIDLADRYRITSNRESGFGRYDVVLEPLKAEYDAIIIEFKVFKPKKEKNLEETVQNALNQIEREQYATDLVMKGIKPEKIRKYGFAFRGKEVLIG